MNDDYLWDRSGAPDPEIARLEQMLAPFAQPEPAPMVRLKPDTTGGWAFRREADPTQAGRWFGVALLAASVIVVVGGLALAFRFRPPVPSFEVAGLEGVTSLPVGGWLETNESAKANIKIANIGEVSVEPRTRLGLLRTRAGDHRLQLARGTLHATIWAPPGQFFVETPSSTAIDLGCAYTLTIDDEGAGLVTVTLGWVGFEWRGREAFIPAGSMCVTRPGIGPGTPYHKDTPSAVRAALDTIDFRSGAPDSSAAVGVVLEAAQERDEVTLWHLLSRLPIGERDRVFDRLAEFVPPPAGVTREGIREGRRDMLDRWWDALGLGTMSWWRTWKQSWTDRR